MEKFGIFELLDALSAIALDGEEQDAPKDGEGETAPKAAPPRPDDSVYAPPVYTGYANEAQERKQNENPPKTAGASAIEDFYKRHDSRGKN